MGRNEALNMILNQFLSTKDIGQAKEDINGLIDTEKDLSYNEGFDAGTDGLEEKKWNRMKLVKW